MNPEKFPIKKELGKFKTSETGYTFNEREKEQGLIDYDEYVNRELNEAIRIHQELKKYREKRREKDESFDFEKWGELEFALKQRERNINAEADNIDAKFDMKVERPNFYEILDNYQNDNEKAA